jgi:hypothetical protein
MNMQEFTELLKYLPKECEWLEFKKDNSNPQRLGNICLCLAEMGLIKSYVMVMSLSGGFVFINC